MNKYLVVFNTCEINVPNLEWYIECIDNLLDTDVSAESAEVKGITSSVWTSTVKDAWKAKLIADKG